MRAAFFFLLLIYLLRDKGDYPPKLSYIILIIYISIFISIYYI